MRHILALLPLLLHSIHADDVITFHDLTATDIDGNAFPFSSLEGKAVLVVNVASECGYTDGHYSQMQKLYDIMGNGGGLEIVAFPCNQFGRQEPADNSAIKVGVSYELGEASDPD